MCGEMRRERLPPGFQFHPTDVELVKYYLKRKLLGKKIHFEAVAEVDVYRYAPWDLPGQSCFSCGDRRRYFFCPLKKYGSGARMNRSTDLGYWKTTGKDRPVQDGGGVVGMIRTLVFYRGKPPKGDQTDWVMHEYRIEAKELGDSGVIHDGYVLCAVFEKDGPSLRNGLHYGAPFREEGWENAGKINGGEVASAAALTVPASVSIGSFEPQLHEPKPYASCPLPVASSNVVSSTENPQVCHDDDILSMLAMFGEEDISIRNDVEKSEVEDCSNCGNAQANLSSDGHGIFDAVEDLEILCPWAADGHFLELMDLDVPLNLCIEAGQCESKETSGVDDVNNYDNLAHQPYYPLNPCYVQDLFNGLSKSPMLPGPPYTFQDQENADNENESVNQLHNIYGVPTFNNGDCTLQTSKVGSIYARESITRGKQQRISYSSLQYTLEFIPAHSTLAVEHLATLTKGTKLKGGEMFYNCWGSSIHVKAEVTRTTDGCTKDALSNNLEESPLICLDGHKFLEVEIRKGTASSSNGFVFVYSLVKFSIFACLCVGAVIAWNLFLCQGVRLFVNISVVRSWLSWAHNQVYLDLVFSALFHMCMCLILPDIPNEVFAFEFRENCMAPAVIPNLGNCSFYTLKY